MIRLVKRKESVGESLGISDRDDLNSSDSEALDAETQDCYEVADTEPCARVEGRRSRTGSKRKKRSTVKTVHHQFAQNEPEKARSIADIMAAEVPAMAERYDVAPETMRRLVMTPPRDPEDSEWYVSLLTTEKERKTKTHVSLSRMPFRKLAIHNNGLVQTKTTRNTHWDMRLVVGPFQRKRAAANFKRRWKRSSRTDASRIRAGVKEAKKIKAAYFFMFDEDNEEDTE